VFKLSSYKEFVNEAIQYHASLPYEMNDIYKKYYVGIPVIEGGKPFRQSSKPAVDAKQLADTIEAKTRLKFDVIISDSVIRNTKKSVTVYTAEKIDTKILDGKILKSSEDKIAAFMNAYAAHYIVINADAGAKENISILFINGGDLPVQVIINAAPDSKLEVSEFYASNTNEGALMATLHEVNAANASQVDINMIHNENEQTYVASVYKVAAGEHSRVRLNAVYCGGIATKARGVLDADSHGRVEATEIAFGSKTQTFDLNTKIVNSKPYSHTNLDSAAVLDGTSKCMLKGFAKVADKSKGAFSRITERGILLSKDAHVDALPDMSIDYSNEVKATHSASTSPIDPEDLFYLTSRGIDEEKARKLFVTAFISKYVSSIENPAMREVAMSILLDKLENQEYGVISEVTPRNIWIANKTK
jgi:Fe-S cluster assembly protein SufD